MRFELFKYASHYPCDVLMCTKHINLLHHRLIIKISSMQLIKVSRSLAGKSTQFELYITCDISRVILIPGRFFEATNPEASLVSAVVEKTAWITLKHCTARV